MSGGSELLPRGTPHPPSTPAQSSLRGAPRVSLFAVRRRGLSISGPDSLYGLSISGPESWNPIWASAQWHVSHQLDSNVPVVHQCDLDWGPSGSLVGPGGHQFSVPSPPPQYVVLYGSPGYVCVSVCSVLPYMHVVLMKCTWVHVP